MALDSGGGGGKPDAVKAFEQWVSGTEPRGGGGGPSGLEGYVYMGTERKTTRRGGGKVDAYTSRAIPKFMSANDAYLQFFQWNEKKQKDFIAQATLGGLMREGEGLMEASRAWKALVAEASLYDDAGKKITPWDIMSSYVRDAGGGNAWVRQGDFEVNTHTGERRYVGPRFKTTTDSRVDLTDPRTAQAIATSVFQEAMGRNPNQSELDAFIKALGRAERANPIVAETTTEFDPATGEAVGRDTTTSGGLTAEARAMIGENQAKEDPEFGAFQAATTYFGALQQAVYGAPG